jgi:succinate dehydrogenase hydrophobic anchor subunit
MGEAKIRLIQYIAAIIIVVFIAIHLQLFTSLIGPGYRDALEYESILSRMRSPFYDAAYTVLLTVLLVHGLIGLRNILYEYFTGPSARRIIKIPILIIFLVLLAYGLIPIVSAGGVVGGGG